MQPLEIAMVKAQFKKLESLLDKNYQACLHCDTETIVQYRREVTETLKLIKKLLET